MPTLNNQELIFKRVFIILWHFDKYPSENIDKNLVPIQIGIFEFLIAFIIRRRLLEKIKVSIENGYPPINITIIIK